MGLIEDELVEVKKLCENVVDGSKIVSCVKTMVRVEIKRTRFKHIIVCIQFPNEYPAKPILIELKSKTLCDKLLMKLTEICEEEAKKILGKPQILPVLKFLRNFVDENPLCCCYEEISNVKKLLTEDEDEFKLKQKLSTINLKIVNRAYYLKSKVKVPDIYPDQPVMIENIETNFPPLFVRYIIAQSKEVGRRCVEPPIRRKLNDPTFKPSVSLEKVVTFLIDCIKRFPNEDCQECQQLCFPRNPADIVTDESAPQHVERLYCGHLFHNGCLITYMRKPPFGNKTCGKCNKKIYHDKWALTDKLAEDRWSHEQARERELAEVTDFLQ